ncbi:MAG: monovalent cation/H+ antiporter subunit D family protein [Candidatus Omnitrophica bacterium]|nr:monovalent cation/H+ antiporter subunit D family protein [Candidatus Omnitrophota bacterium]
MSIIPLFVAIPLASAFLIPMFSKRIRVFSDIFANVTTFILCVMSLGVIGRNAVYTVGLWKPPVGIAMALDGWSVLLLVTVNSISFCATVFSIKYMEQYTSKLRYYSLFLLMVAGMNGVVLSGDLFNLYVFLEIASIASYALVGFGCQHDELEASFKYLVLGSVASTFILLGVAVGYSLTGTLNMADISARLPHDSSTFIFMASCFILGFGLKAALVPFHAWLPDAHPSAPAPISAMLSGVLIKAIGVYALIRLIFNIFGLTPVLSHILLFFGTASMVIGVFLAIGQWDMKRLFAYHSISQIGYVMLGFGLATPLGILGAIFHLMNHAVFKGLLFLTAGSVEYNIHTRQLEEMGGLRERMPVTGFTSLVASMSIAGIPPLNGFWSKLIIIIACVQSGHYIFGLWAAFVSLMTLASFLKVQKFAFFGELKEHNKGVREVPVGMCLSMMILALLCVGMGLLLVPSVRAQLLDPAVASLLRGTEYAAWILSKG